MISRIIRQTGSFEADGDDGERYTVQVLTRYVRIRTRDGAIEEKPAFTCCNGVGSRSTAWPRASIGFTSWPLRCGQIRRMPYEASHKHC